MGRFEVSQKAQKKYIQHPYIYITRGYSTTSTLLLTFSKRCAWGATAVDSLSTAILMDIPDIVDTVLQHLQTVDFPATEVKVSLFQATKTFLGGLLSAHDLLSGPFADTVQDTKVVDRLLEQAQTLADSLTFAFDTPSHLPQNNLMLQPKPKHRHVAGTDITSVGTITLEWVHLATLLGNRSFADLVLRAQSQLFVASEQDHNLMSTGGGGGGGSCREPFPGLLGKDLSLTTGETTSGLGAFISGAGSYYEYLMKLYIYLNSHAAAPADGDAARSIDLRDRWIRAADSTIDHLLSHPSTRPDLTFLASFNCTQLDFWSDHSAFFMAGNFILGGSVLNESKYIDLGLSLVESQVEMYRATATGLGPDRFAWLPESCSTTTTNNNPPDKTNVHVGGCQLPPECVNQTEFYTRAGYCVLDSKNMLRPEVLESLYYAYRVTKDPKYQDMSWEIFQALNNTARLASGGFSEIENVNIPSDPNGGPAGRIDLMYGYFMAETLKYAYLIHASERDEWQVQMDGRNGWVFNTQAHPLRVRKGEENAKAQAKAKAKPSSPVAE